MHRTISIKHRIVRRVDVDRAPLATFDTVDLGDEDVRLTNTQSGSSKSTVGSDGRITSHPQPSESLPSGLFIKDGGLKSKTIGGNNSKKSLSQAGGEEKESKDDRVKDKADVENVSETKQSKGHVPESLQSETKRPEFVPPEHASQKTGTASSDTDRSLEKDAPKSPAVTTLIRQGTIGRVNIPIKKQDSDSSSSSPGSCNETPFTFQASCPSFGRFDKTYGRGHTHEADARKDDSDHFLPEYLDPSHILSPSKRKAYERRIERLKVTTSPIARPRSTAPINVVSLDEYAAISCPEPLPVTPVAQDKLKIILPTDEFTSKPKTPKLHSAKRQNSEDTCFEFTEEFLFSRTKSALVVSEDGQLPLSPRRILIPPHLTPTTSPKLSASPRLSPVSFFEDTTGDTPKLIYIQQSETAHKIFCSTSDGNEENWANFLECSQLDDSVEHDTSTSTVCENDLQGSTLAANGLEWPVPEDCPAVDTVPSDPTNCHLDVLEDSRVSDFAVTEIISGQSDHAGIKFQKTFGVTFDNDIDLTSYNHLGSSPRESTSHTIRHVDEVLHVQLDPDFESEEIITIEINQSAGGCEKHIGIEIKSGDCGESASPVCCYQSTKLESPCSGVPVVVSREIPDLWQESFLTSHSNPGADKPVLLQSVSNDTTSGTSYSYQEVHQHLASDSFQSMTEQPLQLVQEFQLASPYSDSLLFPQTSHLHSAASDVVIDHPHQLSDEKPGLPQRPPSTNPFDIDFEPPVSDPFSISRQFQGTLTNPFLEQTSSVGAGDLIVFSSSMDSTSA